jgi:hypothetical protein
MRANYANGSHKHFQITRLVVSFYALFNIFLGGGIVRGAHLQMFVQQRQREHLFAMRALDDAMYAGVHVVVKLHSGIVAHTVDTSVPILEPAATEFSSAAHEVMDLEAVRVDFSVAAVAVLGLWLHKG